MRLQGTLVALLTPLRRDGSVDPDAVAGHVDRLLAAGVDGLVALGTTGEFADLLPEERDTVVQAVVDAAGELAPVIVGIGAVGTTEACAHARRAEALGADAVLALPPLYWKLDDDAVLRHYARITEATDLPVVLYDFPVLSGTPLSPALVERAARELPQVIGVKQSGPELGVTHAVLERVKPHRPDFSVLTGGAHLVLPSLLAGADGTIAAIGNVAPEPLVGLADAYRSGQLDSAAELHRRVLMLLQIPALCRPPILALKAAAAAWGSPLEPVVRTPPARPEEVVAAAQAVVAALRDAWAQR